MKRFNSSIPKEQQFQKSFLESGRRCQAYPRARSSTSDDFYNGVMSHLGYGLHDSDHYSHTKSGPMTLDYATQTATSYLASGPGDTTNSSYCCDDDDYD